MRVYYCLEIFFNTFDLTYVIAFGVKAFGEMAFDKIKKNDKIVKNLFELYWFNIVKSKNFAGKLILQTWWFNQPEKCFSEIILTRSIQYMYTNWPHVKYCIDSNITSIITLFEYTRKIELRVYSYIYIICKRLQNKSMY